MNKLIELISDRKGKLSTSRLSFLIWSLGLFIIVVYLTYVNNQIPVLPDSLQWLLLILVGNRIGSKYMDNKQSVTQTTTTGSTTIVK